MELEIARKSVPLGLGDAPCDEKWRVRLPAQYSAYFLGYGKDGGSAELYAATFDGTDVLLWPKAEFLSWRDELQECEGPERPKNRRLLLAAQLYGGETEIDRQGRFVLPRNVREALGLSQSGIEFKVLNDGPIRLMTEQRCEETKKGPVQLGREFDDYAADKYTEYLGGNRGKQGAE